jgi:probable F420-dependent oxidoreductase
VSLRIGLVVPPPLPANLDLRHAEIAERQGYDSIWVGEHIAGHVPTLDALTVLSAFAARTSRIGLGTAIVLLPLKTPASVAKAASTVDVISGGRLTLGVGVGGEIPKEFEVSGVPIGERGARADEAIEILRKLWRAPGATHKGRFHQFADIDMQPRPVRAGGVPIVIGGRSEGALRRAALLGDGYMGLFYTPERYAEAIGKIERYATEGGRSLQSFERLMYQYVFVAPTRPQAFERANVFLSHTHGISFEKHIDRFCAIGTVRECVESLGGYLAAGVEHLMLVPTVLDAREFAEQAEVCADEIVPELRRRGQVA